MADGLAVKTQGREGRGRTLPGLSSRLRVFAGRPARLAALSLVEIMVAISLLVVVAWGGMAFLVNERVVVDHAARERTAAQVGWERLERARAIGYAALTGGSGTTTVNGMDYRWTLSVTATTADPGDVNSRIKDVQVAVTWPNSPGALVLRTAVAP